MRARLRGADRRRRTPPFRRPAAVVVRRQIRTGVEVSILAVAGFITLVPVLWLWLNSLRSEREIIRQPLGFPTSPQLSNFSEAWVVGDFGRLFANSIIVTIPVVIAVVSLSALAGYGLARFAFLGSRAVFYVFLLGLMVPFVAIMVPLFFDLRDLRLLGTYWAMILPSVALGLPFGIFLMRAFFRGLARELVDAALVDGCSELAAFWRVMLPLTKPAALSLAIFQFMFTWNAFLMPLLYLQREELRPLSLGLVFFQGRYSADAHLLYAGITIVTMPVVLFYLLLQRRVIDGLTAGAVKG